MNNAATLAAVASMTLSSLAAATVAGAHSGRDTKTKAKAKTQTIDIRFTAVAGNEPVACGKPITGLGTTKTTAQLADLRFYVSEARLLRANGTTVPVKLAADSGTRLTRGNDRLTMIDLEDATGSCSKGTPVVRPSVKGTVPTGKYAGVQFTIGVPFALNHSDFAAAPAPLNLAAMAWSWQSGRKFVKIEVTDPDGASGQWKAKLFAVHLGSTGCTGNPATGETVSCKSSNRVPVKLKKFDPAKQQVAIDIAKLLSANDVTVNGGGAPGCMSGPTDPECAGVMPAFGLDWKADGTGTGSPSTTAQRVFSVISR